jgi:hypothetical protein
MLISLHISYGKIHLIVLNVNTLVNLFSYIIALALNRSTIPVVMPLKKGIQAWIPSFEGMTQCCI